MLKKERKYDELGEDWKCYQQQGGRQDFDSFKHTKGNDRSQYQQASGEHFADFFESFFGGRSSRRQSRQRPQKGNDYNAQIKISLEDAFAGTTRQLTLDTQKLEMKIKPGIKDGQVLRLKGKGSKGFNGGADGDLYITIDVAEHAVYKRKEDDLYCNINVDLYTAILGGQTTINTLHRAIKMNIAKETDNGKVLRLKGMGMPKYDKPTEFGDLYATINITTPKNLSPKEIELFTALSNIKKTQMQTLDQPLKNSVIKYQKKICCSEVALFRERDNAVISH